MTATSTATFAYAETPTPQQSTAVWFKLEENANCRKGPNVFYDSITSLLAGRQIEVVGRMDPQQWHSTTIWWLVRISGSLESCWVSGATGTLSSETALLPVVQAPSLPNAPANFRNTSACPEKGKTRSVKLSWVGVPGATGYLLYRFADDGKEKLIAMLPADAIAFKDQLPSDAHYTYELAATNEYGASGRVAAWIQVCK